MTMTMLYWIIIVLICLIGGLSIWLHTVKKELHEGEKHRQGWEKNWNETRDRYVSAKQCILLLLQQSKYNDRDSFEMSKGTYFLAYRMAGGINETPEDWKTLERLLDIEKSIATKDREDARKGKTNA